MQPSSQAEETKVAGEPKTQLIVRIGSHDIDFTHFPPLTVGDRKKLLRDYKVDFNKMTEFSSEDQDKFVLFLVRKLRPEVTEQDVEALPVKIAGQIAAHAMRLSAEVDSPFSTRSTSSAGSTGGAGAS